MKMNKKKLIRLNFRENVFSRDNNTCKFCNIKDNLDAHHITDRTLMPNGGYVKENGISLCEKHHMDAEEYHITGGKNYIKGMHPEDLYKMIGSSKELAEKKSERLK